MLGFFLVEDWSVFITNIYHYSVMACVEVEKVLLSIGCGVCRMLSLWFTVTLLFLFFILIYHHGNCTCRTAVAVFIFMVLMWLAAGAGLGAVIVSNIVICFVTYI